MKKHKSFVLLGVAIFGLVLSGCNKTPAPQEFTISFDSRGGSEVSSLKVKEGERVTKPTDPTKDDATFVAWYEESSLTHEFDFSTPITKDWTLYAGWQDIEFTVTFDSQGGSPVSAVTVKKGNAVAEPTAPTRDNYTFEGWFLEAEALNKYNFSSPVNANLTLFAGWKDIEYTITFDSQGGSTVAPIVVKKGQTATAPTSPTMKYYTFTGWYEEQELNTLFDFSTPITKDWTLYAGWEETPANVSLKTAAFADIQLCAKENGEPPVMGNNSNTVHAYLSLRNHFQLCKEQGVDVIFMNGDITNNAISEYYDLYEEALTGVFGTDESKYPEIIWNMGNHEWWDDQEKETANAVKLFKQHARIGNVEAQTTVTYYLDDDEILPTYYKVIKGIPFLVISGENSAGEIGDAMKEEIAGWLEDISKLESVIEGGPIYVAYHYALHTTLTHGNGAYPQALVLEELLENYPQAIVFTGDTHYSGVNERAINQVEFTTINIGSSSYSRMDKMSATMTGDEHFDNMKIKGGKTSDELLGNANFKHEYTPTIHLMKTFDNLNTSIDRYFSTDDAEHPIHINKTWNIPRGSNPDNFKYTYDRFVNPDAAQELYSANGVSWANNAEVKFGVKNGQMTVIFPDTNEYHYTEHFKIEVTGNTTKTYDVVSNYYKYNLEPENLYYVLDDLPDGDSYSVKVTAYDYFDNPSLNYLMSNTNDLSICVDEIDDAYTKTYSDISTRVYFDDHASNSNSSLEYYYNGVMQFNGGAILNKLVYSNGDVSDYLSICDTEECEVIVKAKVKNLSSDTLSFGLTVVDNHGSWKADFGIDTRKTIDPNSDWTQLEWNLTDMYDMVGRSSVSHLGIKVASSGYDAEGYEMHLLLDDVDLVAGDHVYPTEEPSRYNIEMCNYEAGAWRGTGSAAEMCYDDTYGTNSFTSRKITFANSENLPATAEPSNYNTVNASFNLRTSLGENEIDAKNCVLSFDVKLSEEFYTSGHSVKHMFTLKIEDNGWANKSSWCDFYPTGAAGFSPENTDNGWIHVEIDLSTKSDYSSLAVGTNVLTFGFFGITQTTRQTAYIIMDNIALTAKA